MYSHALCCARDEEVKCTNIKKCLAGQQDIR